MDRFLHRNIATDAAAAWITDGSCRCLTRTAKEKETRRQDYPAAVKAEHEAVKKGNTNFKGIEG